MYYLILALVCVGALEARTWAGTPERSIGINQWPGDIPNGDSAVMIAIRVLSPDRSPKIQSSAVMSAKVSTLFLSDSLAKQWAGTDSTLRVWKVDLKAAKSALKTFGLMSQSEESRDFSVYLDSARGIVYRIVSRAPQSEGKLLGAPAIAEEQGQIVYPDYPPKTSLFEVLAKCVANPQRAYYIDVAYVMRKAGGLLEESKLRAVWDIQLHGVTVPPTGRRAKPQRNTTQYCRSIIDADTGEFLVGSN